MIDFTNLFEAVPVEELLQGHDNKLQPFTVTKFRPVLRERVEEALREFGEKVWDISAAYNSNIGLFA